MTLIKVMERKMDAKGEILWKIIEDPKGIKQKVAEHITYYIDLTSEQEEFLAKTKRYAFERCDPAKVTDQQKADGQKKKLQLFPV